MAGKTVLLEEFMKEPLLFREESSGAYEVFQSAVNQTGLTVHLFGKALPRQRLWKQYITD